MSSCGECSVCCELFSIKELNKPKQSMCDKCTGTGCGIYDKRPQTCREYFCFYISENLQEEARPDRCGVLFDYNKKKNRIEALLLTQLADEKMVKSVIKKLEQKYGSSVYGVNAIEKQVTI